MFYFQVGWIRTHPHLTCASMYKSVILQFFTCRETPFRLYLNNLLFPETWIPIPNSKCRFKKLKGYLCPYSVFEVCFCTSRENKQQMGNMDATAEVFLATSVVASVTVSGCESTTLASSKDQPLPQPLKLYASNYHPPLLRVTPSDSAICSASTPLAVTNDQPQPAPTSNFISPGQREVSGGSRVRLRRRRNNRKALPRSYEPYILSPPSASLSATPSDTVTGSASIHLASTKDQPQPAPSPTSQPWVVGLEVSGGSRDRRRQLQQASAAAAAGVGAAAAAALLPVSPGQCDLKSAAAPAGVGSGCGGGINGKRRRQRVRWRRVVSLPTAIAT
jgi:hypothetical protein